MKLQIFFNQGQTQSPNWKQGSNYQFLAAFAELLVIFLEIIEITLQSGYCYNERVNF